jgi:hypothetical protein
MLKAKLPDADLIFRVSTRICIYLPGFNVVEILLDDPFQQ